jgi:hypothetical protein
LAVATVFKVVLAKVVAAFDGVVVGSRIAVVTDSSVVVLVKVSCAQANGKPHRKRLGRNCITTVDESLV